MKAKVEFVFEMDVPDTANYDQKNNMIGNVLDEIVEKSNSFITPVEYSWRKAWGNTDKE